MLLAIWFPMYTPCNLEIQPGQASETGKCDPRHEIWDRILLVTFWQNVVFLDPEGKVTQKIVFTWKNTFVAFQNTQNYWNRFIILEVRLILILATMNFLWHCAHGRILTDFAMKSKNPRISWQNLSGSDREHNAIKKSSSPILKLT